MTKAEKKKAVKALAFDLFKQAAALEVRSFTINYESTSRPEYADGLDNLLDLVSTIAEASESVAEAYFDAEEEEGEE
jgi:hypothetical protein